MSLAHFNNMDCAVRYVFQVLCATPRFPNLAMEAAVSSGKLRFLRNSSAHPPFSPYFFVPFAGTGANFEPVPYINYEMARTGVG